MNRIEQRFNELRANKETAFIPYITAGDPNLDATEAVVYALERAGADIVEFGIPFSDPVGDGPVIQEAAQRALAEGTTPAKIMATIKRIRKNSQIPILLFTYFNPVLAYGIDKFAADAADAGVDGVLCVDLPPEEADDYKAALDKNGLCTVFLTAPTSDDERLTLISKQCTGFVYYVSQMGVTGERTKLADDLGDALARIKQHTDKPIAVGFGIATPQQAETVAGLAEGVVVGSAIVRLIAQCGHLYTLGEEVEAFVKELVEATKSKA